MNMKRQVTIHVDEIPGRPDSPEEEDDEKTQEEIAEEVPEGGEPPKHEQPQAATDKCGGAPVSLAEFLQSSFRRLEHDLARGHMQVLAILEEYEGETGKNMLTPPAMWNASSAHSLASCDTERGLSAPDAPGNTHRSDWHRNDNITTGSSASGFERQRTLGAKTSALKNESGSSTWATIVPAVSTAKTLKSGGCDEFNMLPIWTRRVGMPDTQARGLSEWVQKKRSKEDTHGDSDLMELGDSKQHWTIHPHHPGRTIWDFSSLAIVMYDIIMIPLLFFELELPLFWDLMAWLVRLFWTIDIPLTFFSGFVRNDGHIERSRPVIARQYMRTWFSIDLIIITLDWVEVIIKLAVSGASGVVRISKITRIFRIVRMIRLLRLAKIGQVVNVLLEHVCSDRLRIIIGVAKYMLLMVISGHVMACVWYTLGNNGWVSAEGCLDHSIEYCYIVSFRWSLAQFGGGMDEVVPVTVGEHVFAVFAYLASFWGGAVLVSTLTSMMTQFFIDGSQENTHLSILRRYLEQNHISKNLTLRLARNAKHALSQRRKMVHEEFIEVMPMMSDPLRCELHFEIYGPSLVSHPFFEIFMAACPYVIKRVVHNAMSTIRVAAGDIVFNAGEIPTSPRMYIISSGVLDYRRSSMPSQELVAGCWVSEAALWVAWTHRGVLAASEDSCLYALDALEFQGISSHFEYSREFDPRDYAERVVNFLNASESSAVSDVITRQQLETALGFNDDSGRHASIGASFQHWMFRRDSAIRRTMAMRKSHF